MFTQNKNLKKIETPVLGETLSMLLLAVMPRHWLQDVVFLYTSVTYEALCHAIGHQVIYH